MDCNVNLNISTSKIGILGSNTLTGFLYKDKYYKKLLEGDLKVFITLEDTGEWRHSCTLEQIQAFMKDIEWLKGNKNVGIKIVRKRY